MIIARLDDGVDGDIFVVVIWGLCEKFANLCDGDGGCERSVVGWCDVFESYSDCAGLGLRSGEWMMCGLGVVFNGSSL